MQELTRTWVTVQEAADHLGVDTKTIRRRVRSGDLVAYQLRGRGNGPIRLRAADVEALLAPVIAAEAAE